MFLAVPVVLAGGSLIPVIFLYLLAGWAWYSYERKKSRLYRPMYISSQLRWLLIIAWPLVCAIRARESLKRRFDQERFSVLCGESQEMRRFGDWAEAKAYAWEQANIRQEAIAVFDNAKLRKNRFQNELSAAMYSVMKTGKIVRCFSRWR